MDDLQIDNLKRVIGQLEIRLGATQIKQAISDFTSTEGTFDNFNKGLALLNVPVSQLDTNYYFTSWENWQKIIAVINPILQQFPWESDRFDCDKRSYLVVALTALLFDINTIRPLYCDVYRVSDGQYAYTHYCNVIVDDAGNAYIWDVDNGFGLFGKITSPTPILENCKYILKAVK